MADRTDIEFKSYEGLTLRGWFYSNKSQERAPVIVMSHGVCFTTVLKYLPVVC